MRRRAILAGGAASGLAGAARAQTPLPVVGFLHSNAAAVSAHTLAGLRAGLAEAGFVDGRTAVVEARWADGDYGRLPALARELVALRASVIVAGGSELPALAARAVAGATPIVFVFGVDPVRAGLVASFNRPGGNVTGILQNAPQLTAKRFGLLRDALPAARRFGMLVNPAYPASAEQRREVAEAASRAGLRLTVVEVDGTAPLDSAFAALARDGVEALLIGSDPMLNARRAETVALAARHRLPDMHSWREAAEAGGLMSYGTALAETYRQAGVYAGCILRGERPADLPVVQAARFELVVNMKTARALGLDLPPGFIAQADEVIE